MLHVVPLQPLAYQTAVARGTEVDKPRTLAQSETVESRLNSLVYLKVAR